MSLYENIFVARQDLSPVQVEALTTDFSKIITEQSGEIKKSEYCGLRNLAYIIKKNRKGHYVLLHIKALPAAINEMERKMRLNEDIIRYLTIATDEHQSGPSILLQQLRAPQESHRGDYSSHEEFEEADKPKTPIEKVVEE